MASIGEKWYYFRGTSALGEFGALQALGPSGVRIAPHNTTLRRVVRLYLANVSDRYAGKLVVIFLHRDYFLHLLPFVSFKQVLNFRATYDLATMR